MFRAGKAQAKVNTNLYEMQVWRGNGNLTVGTAMGPEQKRLTDRLFNDPERRTLNFKITPGERRVSSEELCAEINKALDDIESGNAEEVGPIDSGLEPFDTRNWSKDQ